MKSKTILKVLAKQKREKMLKLLKVSEVKVEKNDCEYAHDNSFNKSIEKSDASEDELKKRSSNVNLVANSVNSITASVWKENRKRTEHDPEMVVRKKPKKQDTITLMFSNIPRDLTNIKVHEFFKSKGIQVLGCRANYAMQVAFIDVNTKQSNKALALDGEEWSGFQLAVKVDEVPRSRPKIKKDLGRSEKDGQTLLITNLPYTALAKQVETLFKNVQDVRILTDKDTGRSKGTALVQFETKEDMLQAYSSKDDLELEGQQLVVDVYLKQSKGSEEKNKRENEMALGKKKQGQRNFKEKGDYKRSFEKSHRGTFGRGGSRGRGFERGSSRGRGFSRESGGRGFSRGSSRGRGFSRGSGGGRGFSRGSGGGRGFLRGSSRGRGFMSRGSSGRGGDRGGFGRGGGTGRGNSRGRSFGAGRGRSSGFGRGGGRARGSFRGGGKR